MQHKSGWAALAALILIASAASAQDMGDAGPSGGFELEQTVKGGKGRTFLDGRIDLMHRGLAAGSVNLGFDLGVDATFDLRDGNDRYAFFGAIVVDPGFGNIAVGAPRSIGGVLINRPAFAGNRALDRRVDDFMPPLADNLSRALQAQSMGVRFDAESAGLRYGASLQKLDGVDGMFLQAAGEYSFGQGAVEGVLEKKTDTSGLNALVGVTGDASQFDYGVYLGYLDRGEDTTSLQASVGFGVSESLRVGGDAAVSTRNGSEQTLIGASAQYNFSSGVYGQLGVSDGNDTRATWDASIGFEF